MINGQVPNESPYKVHFHTVNDTGHEAIQYALLLLRNGKLLFYGDAFSGRATENLMTVRK